MPAAGAPRAVRAAVCRLQFVFVMRGDAIPELIASDEPSNVQTVELCSERHENARCMLLRNHEGPHECLGMHGPISWSTPHR